MRSRILRKLSLLALCCGWFSLFLSACNNSGGSGGSGSSPAAVTPTNAYPYQNNGSQIDPRVALYGMGQWVTVDGSHYFSPNVESTFTEEEWAPYRNGSWSYEPQRGMTWISNDRWGYMTEHYGLWRHHATHGWLWLPFEDRHFEPHCVTWLDSGDYIGWYPYNARYRDFYVNAGNRSFDDGYWLGSRLGVNIGAPDFPYRPGLAFVQRADFASPNLFSVIVNRRIPSNAPALTMFQSSFAQGRLYANPGGGRTFAEGFEFVQRGARGQIPTTSFDRVVTKDGATLIQPRETYHNPTEGIGPSARNQQRDLRPTQEIVPSAREQQRDQQGTQDIVPTARDQQRNLRPAQESAPTAPDHEPSATDRSRERQTEEVSAPAKRAREQVVTPKQERTRESSQQRERLNSGEEGGEAAKEHQKETSAQQNFKSRGEDDNTDSRLDRSIPNPRGTVVPGQTPKKDRAS